jgi:hypothetical protein
MKKQFLVEIEIPEGTGDLCWDQDETGLQAFHDCIVTQLSITNLREFVASQDEEIEYRNFIDRQNSVRKSFKVISPKPL